MALVIRGTFNDCFLRVIDRRYGFVDDRLDRNNWTDGKVGSGELRGTKFGICAAIHPSVDIRNLTIGDAREIYLKEYWEKLGCEALPYPVNYAVFASATVPHFGPTKVAVWLQEAAEVQQDGIIGYVTQKAVKANRDLVLRRFAGIVLLRMTYLPKWQSNGAGWSRAIAEILIDQ